MANKVALKDRTISTIAVIRAWEGVAAISSTSNEVPTEAMALAEAKEATNISSKWEAAGHSNRITNSI